LRMGSKGMYGSCVRITVRSPCYTRATYERFRDKGLIYKFVCFFILRYRSGTGYDTQHSIRVFILESSTHPALHVGSKGVNAGCNLI